MKIKLLYAIILFTSTICNAAVFSVDNTNDNGAGSLRQAVIDANDSLGLDTVIFSSATDGDITNLFSGVIVIDDDLVILGNGPANSILGTASDLISISPNINVSIKGISFYNFTNYAITRPFSAASTCELTVVNCLFSATATSSGIQYSVLDGTIRVDSCNFSNLRNGTEIVAYKNATIRNNYASNCTGGTAGLALYDAYNSGTIIFTNNTAENCNNGFSIGIAVSGEVSNNTAYNNTDAGFLISLPSSGTSTVIISNNTSANNNIGLELNEQDDASTITVQNCILWNNSFNDFYLNSFMMNGGNPVFSHNIGTSSSSPYGPPSFFSSADPLLDTAGTANNGGFTPTIAIDSGSSAIDSALSLNAPASDQRGFLRNANADIGAFEYYGFDCSIPAQSTDMQTACGSFLWIDGNTYTSDNDSATFTIVGGASSGCDSVVTLDLTILQSSTGTDTRVECDSLTWLDGNVYTSDNDTATYNIAGGAANGCDSIVTLNLTIISHAVGTDSRTECAPFTWIDGNTYTANDSTAIFAITGGAANGCDSVVTLDLTIKSVSDNSTTSTGLIITANNDSATYVWLDCDSAYSVIPGQTGQSFSPASNGNYAVQLTEDGCVDTSACVPITTVGILENDFGAGFILYPNPTKGNFSVNLGSVHENVKVMITDLSGKLIETKSFNEIRMFSFSLDQVSGVYLLSILSGDKRAMIRLLKE